MNINDLPMPTQEQIEQIADRVGSTTLDYTNVDIVRLCSLIIWQDKQAESPTEVE